MKSRALATLILALGCEAATSSSSAGGGAGDATSDGANDADPIPLLDAAGGIEAEGSDPEIATADTQEAGGAEQDLPCSAFSAITPFDYPYRRCERGFVEFSFHADASGHISRGFAQFFRVYKEAALIQKYEVFHDTYDGGLDCWAVTRGNSATGESEQVVWENVGDVVFVGPASSATATKDGDPGSILSYRFEPGEGTEPVFGGAYGFTASDGGAAALPGGARIRQPEAIAWIAPALSSTSVVLRGAAAFEWLPDSEPGYMLIAFFKPLENGRTFTGGCVVADTGHFTVPEALFSELPSGSVLGVHVERKARRYVMLNEFEGIRLQAAASLSGRVTLQ